MHELLQHTSVDEDVAPGGEPLAIEVGGGVRQRVGWVVDQRDHGVGHHIAESVLEQAAPLGDGLTVERAGDDTEEHRRHVRVEHHRHSLRRRLDRAQQPSCTIGRFLRCLRQIELVGRTADTEPEPGLAIGGEVGERFVPQLLLDHLDAIRLGKPGPLVARAELDVVAGVGQHLGDGSGVERARIREPGAAIADDTNADALALRADEVLDRPLVDTDVGLAVA